MTSWKPRKGWPWRVAGETPPCVKSRSEQGWVRSSGMVERGMLVVPPTPSFRPDRFQTTKHGRKNANQNSRQGLPCHLQLKSPRCLYNSRLTVHGDRERQTPKHVPGELKNATHTLKNGKTWQRTTCSAKNTYFDELTFASQYASAPDTTATWSKKTPRRMPPTRTELPTKTEAPMSLAPAENSHSADPPSFANPAGHHRFTHLSRRRTPGRGTVALENVWRRCC